MKIRGQKKLKVIDRYFGIPVVFLLGLLKRKRKLPKKIKNVGLLLTPAIGDTILISAPLKDLKKQLKPDKFIFLVQEGNEEAAELINIADEIIPINLIRIFKTIQVIRQFSFDLFIDAAQWSRTNAILTFFAKSNYKIGFDTNKQGRKYIYDKCAIHSGKVHEINNFRNLIRLAEVESVSLPEINIHSQTDEKKISIHINAGGYLSYLKEWPGKNWIEIIEYFKARNFNLFFTGGRKRL